MLGKGGIQPPASVCACSGHTTMQLLQVSEASGQSAFGPSTLTLTDEAGEDAELHP